MNKAIIYTKTGCPYCAAAKEDLEKRGIPYEEINITEHPEMRSKVIETTGGKNIVPVIIEGGTIIIGFSGGG